MQTFIPATSAEGIVGEQHRRYIAIHSIVSITAKPNPGRGHLTRLTSGESVYLSEDAFAIVLKAPEVDPVVDLKDDTDYGDAGYNLPPAADLVADNTDPEEEIG